jgi:hypothetical protein
VHKERTRQSVYALCEEKGSFVPVAVINLEQIKSMVRIALADLAAAKAWVKEASKKGGEWNALYKLHYDVLHQLSEALVYFDKIKVKTHECLFAYLCTEHPELDLD